MKKDQPEAATRKRDSKPRPVHLVYHIEDANGATVEGATLVPVVCTRNAATALRALVPGTQHMEMTPAE